jgi:SpoIID/LytB domain protein
MDPQAFDRNRRTFILAAAVLAAGGALSCEQPQGLKRSRSSKPLEGGEAGASGATGASGAGSDAAKTTPTGGNAAKQPSANTAKQGADAAKADGTTPKPPAPPVERPLPPTTEPAIRVKSGGLPKSDPKIRIDGPGAHLWIIEPGNAQPGTVGQSPVEFRWTDAGWKATEAAGTSRARPLALPARATLEIMALRDEPQRLKLSGATSIAGGKESEWPGIVRLVPQPTDPNEPVDVVHEVPMETYLPGVLAQELFNKWTVNVHRAQAVAARSWALCEIAQWRHRRHFDVVAGELGQAWIGATKHQRSIDAVADTRGEVLLWTGRVVPAYYSSCCGGERASARDAISSSIVHDIPPLMVTKKDGRDCCSSSPTYRWQSKFDLATFARTLPAWAREEGYASLFKVDGLRRIEIAERNAAGRPVRFQITDAKGMLYEVQAERLRFALNADPARPGNLRPSKERLKSAFIEPLVVGKELVVSGRGHGHGVGMCQYGAEAMAKKGAKPSAILSRYYPGADLVKAYA